MELKTITIKRGTDEDLTITLDIYGGVAINGLELSCEELGILAHLALDMRSKTFLERGDM